MVLHMALELLWCLKERMSARSVFLQVLEGQLPVLQGFHVVITWHPVHLKVEIKKIKFSLIVEKENAIVETATFLFHVYSAINKKVQRGVLCPKEIPFWSSNYIKLMFPSSALRFPRLPVCAAVRVLKWNIRRPNEIHLFSHVLNIKHALKGLTEVTHEFVWNLTCKVKYFRMKIWLQSRAQYIFSNLYWYLLVSCIFLWNTK